MALKLSAEYLVGWYVRSATNGKILSQRQRRILTVMIIPIWIAGLIICGIMYDDAFNAIPKYRAVQEFKSSRFNHNDDDMNPYGGHRHQGWYSDGASTHQCSFDAHFWVGLGLNNPSHLDSVSGLLAIAERIQLDRLHKFYSLPLFLILFLIVPWILLRLVYWIKDADRVKE